MQITNGEFNDVALVQAYFLIDITVHLLDEDFAPIIADAVWNTSRNLRDCVRIGKLA